jgi:putative transposase
MTFNSLRKGRVSEFGREYIVTTVVAGRLPLLSDVHIARLLMNEVHHVEKQNMGEWLAWVIMPDHFHGLFSLGEHGSLSSMMHMLKGRSARAINQHLVRQGALWMPAFHDRALRHEDDRIAIARYLVANPIRAGLVENIEHWPYWDSVFFD